MNYKIYSALTGLSVWLMATLAFRWWGPLFFLVENKLLMLSFYAFTIPLIFLICQIVFSRLSLSNCKRATSALALAIPGMLADVISISFHDLVFPGLNLAQVSNLGAWVLWAYVLVLISPFLLKAKED